MAVGETRPENEKILDAAGGASAQWMNAMRVLADYGHKASRSHLARTLAREGRLEELRQRAGTETNMPGTGSMRPSAA